MTLFCRHRHELWSSRSGAMRLRCAACGRERVHPWHGIAPGFHRTMDAAAPRLEPTGIERQAFADAEESAAIGAAMAELEAQWQQN